MKERLEMKKLVMCMVIVAVVVLSGTPQASSLEIIGTATYNSNDYNLIYEGQLGGNGLVWLDYTNSPDTWQNQVNWASGLGSSLTVTLDPGYTTTIDWTTLWRLPATYESKADLYGGFGYEGPDASGYHDYAFGYNMVNSEMGHLYYESLENKGYRLTDGTTPSDYGLKNTGPFDNLVADIHWSGTAYSLDTANAWRFHFNNTGFVGYQRDNDKNHTYYALAVRPGSVSAVSIPDASVIYLLSSACLIGFGVSRKNFKK
jgi:hypothetical protein